MSSEIRRLSAVVLAAGEGTRMRSARPKPLHVLCGRPMITWVVSALAACDVTQIGLVVGHGADLVTKRIDEDLGHLPISFARQERQLGTGDAAAVGLTGLDADLDDDHDVLVLPGDTPLLRPETIAALVARHRSVDAACTVLTAVMPDPSGYGRIVRGRDERVIRIVEDRDATDDERAIDEINTGIFCFRGSLLPAALRRLHPANAQGEYYLTDVVEVLAEAGHLVTSVVADDFDETHGVNDRVQLAAAETELRRRINTAHLVAGVTMLDPAGTHVDVDVVLGPDVTLYTGTLLQGRTVVGAGARIGPNTQLLDTTVGERAVVRHTVAERSTIGDDAEVGPFASLAPGSTVPAGARTGPHYAAPGT